MPFNFGKMQGMKINETDSLVLVSVLTFRVVDRWVTPKAMKLVFVASPLSMQHSEVRTKTNWLIVKIMGRSRMTYVYLWTVVSVS